MSTRFKSVFALLIFANATVAGAAPPYYPPADRESTEWCNILIPHANETNLPRVLLIGDSITVQYYPNVEVLLRGKAYVGRMTTSAFVSDPMLLGQIKATLCSMKFDVVHFNNGMHDFQHSEEEYRQKFPEFLKTIQGCAHGAKLIWASTTPLKVSPPAPAPSEPTDSRISERNKIALKFVQAKGIPVDDLYPLMAGHPELHSDNVHFNAAGVARQAEQVAAEIAALLSPSKSN